MGTRVQLLSRVAYVQANSAEEPPGRNHSDEMLSLNLIDAHFTKSTSVQEALAR